MKEIEGVAIWQVLTFQGNNEEEIVSERDGEWQAVAGTGWDPDLMRSLLERGEGRCKEITWKRKKKKKKIIYATLERQETTVTEVRSFGSLFCLLVQLTGGMKECWSPKLRCSLEPVNIVAFGGHTSTPVLLRQD